MRLIDADKLYPDQMTKTGTLAISQNQIANAPTVELTEEQAIDKLHETGWLIKHDKEMIERPQGEWIWSPVADDGTVSGCCNKCSFSHMFIGGHTAQYNFCPNCGLPMKKGGAEE